MDEQIFEQAVEDAPTRWFTGTDERRMVTVTVDGAGKVVELRVIAQDMRRLPTTVFETGVVQAFARARAAAAEDGPAAVALRDLGIDLDALRGITR